MYFLTQQDLAKKGGSSPSLLGPITDFHNLTAVLQIAVQMAVVFAKVARIDYPRAWPSLFTDLLQQLQSQSTLVVRRVYLVLHHALKELASKRLSSDQKAFAAVSSSCHLCLSF